MFRSLFDPNSAFSRGMERVWTLVVLNVLWVLCSLPVVTIGPSTAALYQVLGKVIQGEDSHTARKFFAAWRENFKCALLVWLPMLAVLVLCGFDLYFAVLNDRFLWKLLAVFALQLAAVELTFVFPLMARYQNTWRSHMKNAMLVGVGNLPRMLLIWLIWAVPVGACLVFPWLRLYLSLVWLLAGSADEHVNWLTVGMKVLAFAGMLIGGRYLLRPVFRRLEQPKDDPKKDGTDAS